MTVAIMQPYFLPYIGYFQLINAVDEFVIYDNIQYTKKGWINRNRILTGNGCQYVSLPIKNSSYYLDIKERYLADNWTLERKKTLNKIANSYRNAPQFNRVFPLIENCLLFDELNLFKFILNSVLVVKNFLGIKTKVTLSSQIDIDHHLKAEEKVIGICKALNANSYLNAIGGVNLYSRERFEESGIKLSFLETKPIEYPQFNPEFIPALSIVDVLMFNPIQKVQAMLTKFDLV